MRVNIYAEELTDDVKLVETCTDEGKVFQGVRFYLHSSDRLHLTPRDDDRSAVTFWGSRAQLMRVFDLANDQNSKR